MKYPNAVKGLNRIYIAEILSILVAVLIIVLAAMAGVSHVSTNAGSEEATHALQSTNLGTPFVILGIAMMLLMLVSWCLNLVGIINASKDETGFKQALWFFLASMAFGIAGAIMESSNAKVAGWLKVPSTLFELVVMIYVLEGIANLAKNLGKKEIVDKSAQCRTWLMSALILAAAAEVFATLGTTGTALTTGSGIASGLLQIIAYVIYLRVLNKARLMQ